MNSFEFRSAKNRSKYEAMLQASMVGHPKAVGLYRLKNKSNDNSTLPKK